MPTKTVQMKDLIICHAKIDVLSEDGQFFLYFENENTRLKIKFDDATIAALKQKRQQIATFLEQTITLSGTVVEKYVKRQLTTSQTLEVWERVL